MQRRVLQLATNYFPLQRLRLEAQVGQLRLQLRDPAKDSLGFGRRRRRGRRSERFDVALSRLEFEPDAGKLRIGDLDLIVDGRRH